MCLRHVGHRDDLHVLCCTYHPVIKSTGHLHGQNNILFVDSLSVIRHGVRSISDDSSRLISIWYLMHLRQSRYLSATEVMK